MGTVQQCWICLCCWISSFFPTNLLLLVVNAISLLTRTFIFTLDLVSWPFILFLLRIECILLAYLMHNPATTTSKYLFWFLKMLFHVYIYKFLYTIYVTAWFLKKFNISFIHFIFKNIILIRYWCCFVGVWLHCSCCTTKFSR